MLAVSSPIGTEPSVVRQLDWIHSSSLRNAVHSTTHEPPEPLLRGNCRCVR